jgi:N-hydroxyarylamine O-acetyltransferase
VGNPTSSTQSSKEHQIGNLGFTDIDGYLARIGYCGPRAPVAETLRALHRAHLEAVPFENLDIHLGRPIVLDETALYDKIVRQRRGGFCYELNGLLAALLRCLGFAVTPLSARVVNEAGEVGPEFDHLTLKVEAGGPWLADVGFGDGFSEPLRLDELGAQIRDGIDYRVSRQGADWLTSRREPAGDWQDRYRFSLIPRRLEDFEAMCRYHQTSPTSHFTQDRICSRRVADGLVTLTDDRLILTGAGGRRESRVDSEWAFRMVLAEQFEIKLSPID